MQCLIFICRENDQIRVRENDVLPSPEETKRFYTDNGIPEEKADFIAKSYSRKLELLRDFQKGRTISLYLEKKRMREMKA